MESDLFLAWAISKYGHITWLKVNSKSKQSHQILWLFCCLSNRICNDNNLRVGRISSPPPPPPPPLHTHTHTPCGLRFKSLNISIWYMHSLASFKKTSLLKVFSMYFIYTPVLLLHIFACFIYFLNSHCSRGLFRVKWRLPLQASM